MKNINTIISLVHREIIRFFRQKSRVIGALATPLVFWFFIGSGIGDSFRTIPGADYLNYFFPGILAMIVLFTAIFSTISIIEDRQEGFLQGVLVSPTPRWVIVIGKVLGGTVLALCQAALFMLLLPFLKISMNVSQFVYVFFILAIMGFGLTGLGFILAWRLNSTQGFHAIMNLLLMPMWFLSGALFPLTNVPPWLKGLMMINPLTYAVTALQRGFFVNFSGNPALPSTLTCIAVSIGFGLAMLIISIALVRKTS